MGIKLRNGKWQADVYHNGQRLRQSFDSKTDAEAWLAVARQSLVKGTPVPQVSGSTTNYTLEKAARRCYLMHWKDGKSEDKQIQIIGQLERHFGKHELISSIKTTAIDDYILHMKDNNSAGGTINRKLATLSKILRQAHEEGKLSAMPKLRRQKEGQNRIRWLTHEEEELMLNTLDSWGDQDMIDAIVVSIDTGVRASELLRIKRSDITKEGLYIGDSKNGYPRLVPLTFRARNTLEIRSKTSNNNLLFDFQVNWYRDRFDRLRNHLDLHDVVWHTLRHTCASRLVQGGVPITHVKDWMGHKSITTTMRYAHLAPKHLQVGVSVLEKSSDNLSDNS